MNEDKKEGDATLGFSKHLNWWEQLALLHNLYQSKSYLSYLNGVLTPAAQKVKASKILDLVPTSLTATN